MSLVKNLVNLTKALPRPVVTWDKAERIRRNEEIWKNPDSIVHRLPEHYKMRYWKNHVLADRSPIHYRPPTTRYVWDPTRNVQIEVENYPIVGLHTPEQDEGLWGGERVVKGWRESKPYTKKKVLPRHWLPILWFPKLKFHIVYSEILDKYMKIIVTERALRLIDSYCGLDFYILRCPEIDLDSKFALILKREMLLALARGDFYLDNEEKRNYIGAKYEEFRIPEGEAEWVGLTLNEAAAKQQDIEESIKPEPLKYKLERELVAKLESGTDLKTTEEEFVPKTEESKFGDKLLGKYLNPLAERLRKP
ncbi:hypothetical protein WR25_19956 [Diploscapter pachys]|uniref:Large ribosomal subunit protein bL28m n=1 Tax=Diploscapter pachys TaxID=2018661 RepID=A0A2A2KB22_9BILA|nr:hypothetical protein WR25_19956 [Diploscapter pachys]